VRDWGAAVKKNGDFAVLGPIEDGQYFCEFHTNAAIKKTKRTELKMNAVLALEV